VTPSFTIGASASDTICAGTSVTFSATPDSGGAAPAYIWYRNGTGVGTGSAYTSTTLAGGDVIKCKLTSSVDCAAPDTAISNAITMTVNPLLTPEISIYVSPRDTICAGDTVTFTDSIMNGGASPAYQWRKNGVNETTAASYRVVPTSGDVISCRLTSDAICASPDTGVSNAITMTVNPIVYPAIDVLYLHAFQRRFHSVPTDQQCLVPCYGY